MSNTFTVRKIKVVSLKNKFKYKFISLLILVVLIIAIQYFLPENTELISLYNQYIYYPIQSFRMLFLGFIPISMGDIIYFLWGVSILVTIIRWVYYISNFTTKKIKLAYSFLSVLTSLAAIYFTFLLGWGINYYKEPLAKNWGLQLKNNKPLDSTALISFNKFLTDKLNTTAENYKPFTLSEINNFSKYYYAKLSDCKIRTSGLDVKPTLYGYFMERVGIEGYYNPFTGEGQINGNLPAFLLPFTLCHEMAHQAGIAAEGDANLMSYAICTACENTTFKYSAYLNIWIYANHRLARRDSNLAKGFELQLNSLTRKHLDTIELLSIKYQNIAAHYSSDAYDNYLKMNKQKDGIKSYGSVTGNAYRLEQKRNKNSKTTIHIPDY